MVTSDGEAGSGGRSPAVVAKSPGRRKPAARRSGQTPVLHGRKGDVTGEIVDGFEAVVTYVRGDGRRDIMWRWTSNAPCIDPARLLRSRPERDKWIQAYPNPAGAPADPAQGCQNDGDKPRGAGPLSKINQQPIRRSRSSADRDEQECPTTGHVPAHEGLADLTFVNFGVIEDLHPRLAAVDVVQVLTATVMRKTS